MSKKEKKLETFPESSVFEQYQEAIRNYKESRPLESLYYSLMEQMIEIVYFQPKTKIRTWGDVPLECQEKMRSSQEKGIANANSIHKKFIEVVDTMFKIYVIIELGYGGVINQKEWKNDALMKYTLIDVDGTIAYNDTTDDYAFVAFHTEQQREEFMSYPENVELVKQYYMI